MKRVGGHVVGVVLLAASIAACERQPVVLGIATSPQPIKGAKLALDDAFAAGIDVPFDTVMLEETSNLASPGVRAADSIVAVPGIVAVMGHANSAASLAAAPIYNRAGVVQLSSHSTADAYSEAGPFSFRMVPPDAQQAEVIARFLADEHAGDRVALTWVNDEYGRNLRSRILDVLAEGSVDVVVDVPHTERAPADVRRRSMLAIVDARPDAILWLGRGRELQHYLPGLRRELGRIPVIGGDGLGSVEFLPDPDGLTAPVHFVRLADLQARPGTRRFAERYEARYNQTAPDAAALAYDATGVLVAGIRAGARTGEEMREYLVSLGRERPPYPGITGPVQFDENGDAHREYIMGHVLADTSSEER